MQPFTIQKTLTLADWRALQKASAVRLQQRATSPLWNVALWVVIGFCSSASLDALDIELSLLSALVGVVFCAGVMTVWHKRALRAMEPGAGSPYLNPSEHVFGPEGVISSQAGVHSAIQWQRVSDVTATDEHLFIWFDAVGAYVIPVRDLPDGMTAEQVVAVCKEWIAAAAVKEPGVPSPRPSAAALARNESTRRTVFRLLTLRGVEQPDRNALPGNPAWIGGLALISVALLAGLSWFYHGPDAQFYPYSAPALAWYVLAALAVAVTMAKRSHPQIALSRVCMLLAILVPLLILADFAVVMFVPEQWVDIARLVLGLYAIVYCARGLHALTGNRQPAAVLGGLAVAAIFLASASALYVYPAMWTAADEYDGAAAYEAERDAGEALLFEQPARIDASVARIEPAAGEASAGFFVGFAGYGDQRVFAEEIKFAARAFAERFDTADRTLLLINDRRDRHAQPLATVSGLHYALEEVAAKMRLDRDVLFLALSSHGSEDPLLSVENGMLPLRDLTGEALAEALRASGIRWRVIVISACHAGAFIDSLRDPYTAVITAAAPERTSFGCSDDRDLTYFGEAFFRDSLPQAGSLREAFDTATKLVGEREREQDVEASHPQAFFGADIERRLASMWRVTASQ